MRNSFLLIALSIAASAAAAPPQRVEIGYEIARNGAVLAEVNQRLEHDGRTYRISETWKGKGIYSMRGEAVRSSQGAVVADGLRPRRFEDKRTGRDTLLAEFDPAAKTATLLRQDRLSFIWTFTFSPPTGPVTVNVADGKNTTIYTYQSAGRERVKTPAGEFDALKLVRRKANADDRGTDIWLAADRHFIPLRILSIDKDGTRFDQVAVTISPR